MAFRKRQAPRGKKINPKFWIFCEGETEEAYINYLRIKYRLPVKIITEVTGANINERIISRHLAKREKHEKDRVFLLYDADVESVMCKLKEIKNAHLLTSNPCIELWFLMHYKNQTAHISGNECIRQLNNRNHNTYKKGLIDRKLEEQLNNKQTEACKRAKETIPFTNPSSNINELIVEIESIKKEK